MAGPAGHGPNTIDYDRAAADYPGRRHADPRIERHIHAALADARTVVNIGAGSGSYEPRDRWVLAVEPSAGMRSARPVDAPPAIAASAEALPLDDDSVDAAMAIITIHHWNEPLAGLAEMRRVTRGNVVLVTFDIDILADYWMISDYLPEALEDDRRRFPTITQITSALGGASVLAIPIPSDCSDGFFEAFYCRPEAYLDHRVRAAQSVWPRLPEGVQDRALGALKWDLRSGVWEERHGHLRTERHYDGALRLIVSEPNHHD